jgi:uncharacterized protein with NRDE domain
MCVAAIAIGAHPAWPLVIASNRDEFYERPTAALSHWTSDGGREIVSGRDLRDGGTWLGFSGTRVALLTNVREGSGGKGPRSRGELALRWLQSGEAIDSFYAQLPLPDYAGFNLLVGDWTAGAWFYISNRGAAANQGPQPLQNGFYGLSNASLDTPWPKTVLLKTALQQTLTAGEQPEAMTEHLLATLSHRACAKDEELPQTGVGQDWERRLSSVFIEQHEAGYGTRCSTVALLGADKGLRITERNHPNPLHATEAQALPRTVQVLVPS